jgi:hypothetical protein
VPTLEKRSIAGPPPPIHVRARALAQRDWPWRATLAVGLLAGAVVILHLTRGTTLFADEWTWAMYRRSGLGGLVEAYNGHLSLVPVAIYHLLFATAGAGNYLPYRIVLLAGDLGCAIVVWAYARGRVGEQLAVLGAIVILFLGPAWQDLLWPFQIAWLIAIAASLGALLMLDRHERSRDIAACLLLIVALASTSLAVPLAVAALVEVGWRRRSVRGCWCVLVPLLLYAAWALAYQHEAVRLSTLRLVPAAVADSLAAGISSLLGLSGASFSNAKGTILTLGIPLEVIALLAAAWVIWRRRTWNARALTLLLGELGFAALLALERSSVVLDHSSFSSIPVQSRYILVDAILVLLLAVELLRGIAPSFGLRMLATVVALAVVISNLGVLRSGGFFLRTSAQQARGNLAALTLARPWLRPDSVAAAFPGYPFLILRARPYFAMARAIGTPAYAPRRLPTVPAAAQADADIQLIEFGEISLRPIASTGGGACRTLAPSGHSAAAGRSTQLVLASGSVTIDSAGAPVSLAARRFGSGFVPVGELGADRSAELRVRGDALPIPWHLEFSSQRDARVCVAPVARPAVS